MRLHKTSRNRHPRTLPITLDTRHQSHLLHLNKKTTSPAEEPEREIATVIARDPEHLVVGRVVLERSRGGETRPAAPVALENPVLERPNNKLRPAMPVVVRSRDRENTSGRRVGARLYPGGVAEVTAMPVVLRSRVRENTSGRPG